MTTIEATHNKTLLIAEGDRTAAGNLKRMLSGIMGSNCMVMMVHSLSDALAALSAGSVDAVLLSLSLPDIAGIADLDTLQEAAPETAIIVLDEANSHERAMAAARQGAHDYFIKSELEPAQLASAITYAVQSNQSEWGLRRSESKFRGIIETLEEAYYEVDLVGRYMYVNDTLCRHLQRSREALIGRQSLDFSPPETAERLRQIFIEVYSTGKSGKLVDSEVVRKDGTILHVELSISLLHDMSGEPIGFMGISRDVTDKKSARDALLASEEKYRNILESIEDGYFEVDLDGNFIFFNDRLAVLQGYTREELLRMGYRDYMDEENTRKVKAAYSAIFRSGQPNHLLQYEICRKDGTTAHLESAVSLVRDEDGNPLGFRGVARDITLRKRAEQELARAKEQAEAATLAKSNFLSNMSHEIRTPMNGIIGMYDLLLGTDLDGQQVDYVQTGKQSADSMLAVINDILDFSKIESGTLDVSAVDFNLRKVLRDLIAVPAMQARSKGVEFFHHIDDQIPDLLVGDPGRLRQIIMNITNNAIKFTDSGKIVFEAHLREQSDQSATIHFSVRDTGIGISGEDQARLFNSFEQVNASTTRKYGGTGLGLAIAKRLAELMGGRMGVESEPGRGATFWFTALFDKPNLWNRQAHGQRPQPAHCATGPEVYATGTSCGCILLVEDNMINQKLAMHLIERYGFKGHAVDNGREAVSVLSREDFDLVLMDIQMPEMDGFEATAIIRDPSSSVRNHNIPIIALTAHAMKGDREKCMDAGMDDYISKPVQPEILRQAIARLLPASKQPSPMETNAVTPPDQN